MITRLDPFSTNRAFVVLTTGLCALLGHSQCPPVVPAFSWHSDADGVLFVDQTASPFESPQDHVWDFGDGNGGAGYAAGHVYQNAGLDTVTLSFTAGGCAYSIAGTVAHGMVGDTCTLALAGDFSASPGNNNELYFTQTATAGIQGFLWSFGDGSLDIFSVYPSHIYAFPGAYDVTYAVAMEDTFQGTGCVAGTVRRVFVDGNSSTCDSSLFANMDYTYDNGYATLLGTTQLLNADLALLSIDWDYGDGSSDPSSLPVTVHQYAYPGEYQVCMTVLAQHLSTGDTCEARICRTLVPLLVGEVERFSGLDRFAFPNPFGDHLRIDLPSGEQAEWRLSDLAGRGILGGTWLPSGSATIATDGLPAGGYIVVVSTRAGLRSQLVYKY